MLDCAEYTKNGDGYQGNGNGHHRNGYDKLEGDWLTYYKVGKGFAGRVRPEDKEDFLHDLFLTFARVNASYQTKGKLLTTGGLVRIAQYEIASYWRKWYHHNQNSDCGRCSNRQRQECEANNSYGSKCPKAIKRESLDALVEDGNGDSTPLHELIADDNADFTARLEAKLILEAYPIRFVQLAYKKYAGYPFTNSERNYYYRQCKKAQKSLV
jgi:hypothetical protein